MEETEHLLERINKLRASLERETTLRDRCFHDSDIFAMSVSLDFLIAEYSKRVMKNMKYGRSMHDTVKLERNTYERMPRERSGLKIIA